MCNSVVRNLKHSNIDCKLNQMLSIFNHSLTFHISLNALSILQGKMHNKVITLITESTNILMIKQVVMLLLVS